MLSRAPRRAARRGERPAARLVDGARVLVVDREGHVGQHGVVVEHGVHERRAHLRRVVGVAKVPRGRGPVAVSLGAPDIAPAAAVGDDPGQSEVGEHTDRGAASERTGAGGESCKTNGRFGSVAGAEARGEARGEAR